MSARLSARLPRFSASSLPGAPALLVAMTLVTGVSWSLAHVRAERAAELRLAQQAEVIRLAIVRRVEDYTAFLAQWADTSRRGDLPSADRPEGADGLRAVYLASVARVSDAALSNWLGALSAGSGPRLSPAMAWPDREKAVPGLALPVVRRGEARAQGFVYLPLELDDLARDVPGLGKPGLEVRLSDGPPGSGADTLFRSAGQAAADAPRVSVPVGLPGRTWTLDVAGHPSAAGLDPAYLGVLGLGLNGMLFAGMLALRRRPEPSPEPLGPASGAAGTEAGPAAGLVQGEAAAVGDPRARSRFFAHVSEEIRGALQTITLSTRLCLDARVSELQRDYLECSLKSSSHLVDTLNGVLDLLMIEAGELVVTEERFEIRPLILELAECTEAWLQGKAVSLEWMLADDVPAVLRGDCTLLRKTLYSLCRNAARFTEAGRIRITCRLARWESTRAVLDFCIEDSGERGPQAGSAQLADVVDGMGGSIAGPGLGLAVSRRLVELQDGILWVSEGADGGSVVHFTLPFAPVAATAGPRPDRPEPGLRSRPAANPWDVPGAPLGAHVLVVEDNSVNRYVAREMLTRMGLRVSEAGTGMEALQRLREGHVDLVLMDLRMPDMGGCETARLVRGNPALRKLPIVAMTGNTSPSVAAECRDAGMDDLVFKPVDPATLSAVLSRHLGRSGPSPAEVAQGGACGLAADVLSGRGGPER
ncbi:response regulator [Zoogloea sp.]|uniref:response regulator n=1 Tax=Zoogloea sp. TaxID=49181 RepID=UPI001416947A|nr:MAG: response regulator [Zoogloea sp.]